jgi:hypothetical protein
MAKNEFDGALAELRAAEQNTDAINQSLSQVQMQWNLFKHGLDKNKNELVPLIVALGSEKLLSTMNEITHMYEVISSE